MGGGQVLVHEATGIPPGSRGNPDGLVQRLASRQGRRPLGGLRPDLRAGTRPEDGALPLAALGPRRIGHPPVPLGRGVARPPPRPPDLDSLWGGPLVWDPVRPPS